MKHFHGRMPCAVNILCFLLLLLWGTRHRNIHASGFQARIQAQAFDLTARSFTGLSSGQQRVDWPLIANLPIESSHLSTTGQRDIYFKEKEKLLRNFRSADRLDSARASKRLEDIIKSKGKGSEMYQDLQFTSNPDAMMERDAGDDISTEASDHAATKPTLLVVEAAVTQGSGCVGAISATEYQALQDLYLATGGDNWHWHSKMSIVNQTQWVFPSNLTAPCSDDWEGVHCSPYRSALGVNVSCSIIALELPLTGLRGQIPASIANLLQLEILNLEINNLEGSIPASLGSLTALTILGMNQNSLTGRIPSSLSNLTALTELYLYENSLTGPIPFSLGNLTAVRELELNQNSLTGPIPFSLGDLTALTLLYLYENSLTGPIPTSLGDLTALTKLGMNQNLLTGRIPSSLGNLAALTELYLYENSLSGPFPTSLTGLTALTILVLFENSLMGPIPSSIGDSTALTLLDLAGNSLTGPIPSSLGDLTALTQLYLFANSLTGPIPASLGNLTLLTLLDLYGNFLTGPIPSSLGQLAALTLLYLYENSLTGPIPFSVGDLAQLTQLYLYSNFLTGRIPSSLSQLTALTVLYLNGNSLTGPIPTSLGDLTALTLLYLCDNSLTGTIPSALGNLRSLIQLSVSSNSLVGAIPTSLGFFEKCFYVNMSSNSLTGPIPAALGNLGSNLSIADRLVGVGVALDLSQNAFTGTISPLLFRPQMQTILLYSNCMKGSLPSEICSSSHLQTLVLDKLTSGSSCERSVPGFKGTFAAITLQGSIPDCVWTMPSLMTLHLSGNGLHGTLGDIGSISSLINVDVSNNFLTGSIPTSLQTQHKLQQLALANNKLSGTLSPSFVIGNLTLFALAVNRLSGGIPGSFANAPGVTNFSVLTGNLFACGSRLPAADPDSASYVCGSETLNIGFYICGCAILLLICFAALPLLNLTRYSKFGCVCVNKLQNGVFGYVKQYIKAIQKAASFHRFANAMDMLRVWLGIVGLSYIIISMPTYAILKSTAAAGIFNEQYTWIVTSAFLHGYESMSSIGLFVLFSGAVLAIIVQQLDSLLKRCA